MAVAIVDMPSRILHLARRGAEALLRQQTPTTMGLRFPSVEDAERQDRYGAALYDGAAGVGLVLLDLWRATGDRRFRTLDDRVHCGIVESTPADGDVDLGLFSGHSGIALYQLARARLLQDRIAFMYSLELGERIGRGPFAETDIIDGAAGAGLVQLALYHAAGDTTFLDGARRIAAFLCETAVVEPDIGAQWPPRDRRSPVPKNTSAEYADSAYHLFTGLAHGSAGVLLFLLEYLADTRDGEVSHLVEQGFKALNRVAVPHLDGLGWPRSDHDATLQAQWCHGSTGIAHTYLALHQATGDADALTRAALAGEATWNAARRADHEGSCHCHGLSGAVELFVALAQHTSKSMWLERAHECAAHIGDMAETSTLDGAASPLGAACTFAARGAGLSVGTAGVVRELLRLAGYGVFPIMRPVRERLRFSSPRRAARHAPPADQPRVVLQAQARQELPDLLPPAAAPLKGRKKWLILGPPNERGVEQVLDALSASPAGSTFHASLERIGLACLELTKGFHGVLAPNALTPRSFGKLLRDIAGMCLADGADPRRVHRSATLMTTQTVDAVESLLRRVAFDLSQHGSLRNEVSGPLEEVSIVGGDAHKRGQRVVALRFAGGPELLYKPRSVAVDRELSGASAPGEPPTLVERCNDWLEPHIAGARLATHRLIDAGDWHGYAERVSVSCTAELMPDVSLDLPVADLGYSLPLPRVAVLAEGDETRFWYSAGLLAGFAFSLGVYDLHAENIMMATSRSSPDVLPHIVDGELAFGCVEGLAATQLVPRAGGPPTDRLHDHCGLTMSVDFECALFAEEWNLELTTACTRPGVRPYQSASWMFPHVVRNPDGSFGFRDHLCPLLRGLANAWEVLRRHSSEVEAHLRSTLTGRPSRLLRKRTQSYWAERERRRMGGSPILGRAHFRGRLASRLDEAELRQLDTLDFPYYVRFLGEEEQGRAGLWWATGKRQRLVQGPSLGDSAVPPPLPFWSIVERQADPALFARAIADAVLCVAPPTPFDFRDAALGVRVVRTAEDPRIVAALLLGSGRRQRLTCRMMPDTGEAEYWLE